VKENKPSPRILGIIPQTVIIHIRIQSNPIANQSSQLNPPTTFPLQLFSSFFCFPIKTQEDPSFQSKLRRGLQYQGPYDRTPQIPLRPRFLLSSLFSLDNSYYISPPTPVIFAVISNESILTVNHHLLHPPPLLSYYLILIQNHT